MKKKLWMICAAVLAASLPAFAEEAPEQTVDWNIFLVGNPEEYVTLGEYTDLEVTKTMYTITDEDVEIEIDSRLSTYSTTEPADRAPQIGDIVTMDVTFTAMGETYTEPDFQIEYGYAYLGDDFDDELEGVLPGETRTFSVDYDEDAEIEGWENQTVDFEVTVTAVETIKMPELTDDWVKENTNYESIEEYSASVKEELQAEYDRQSEQDAAASALSAAMEEASFHDYPEDMYEAALNMSRSQYTMMADMFGMTLEELYDSYGMTEEDLDEEAVELVNTYLLVSAIAKEESITVGEEEKKAYAEANYEDYGYIDAEEMLEDTPEGELTVYALQDKVSAFLLENADVTVQEAYSEEDYDLDDSSAIDLEWDEDDWDEEWGDEEEWEDDTDDMAEIDWADIDWDAAG